MNTTAERVCIVGAGPTGLAVCKTLKEAGVSFDCFDAGRSVGGVWDVEGGYGGGYRSLETNTSIEKMEFSDFPFPDGSPMFVHHSQLLAYFNAYADHFALRDDIHLGVRVVDATPTEDDQWVVRFEAGEPKTYAAFIVCSGQYGTTRWPKPHPEGSFAGEQIHASDYLDPETPVECRGKRVVVVGLGSSAAEIATELAGGEGSKTIASHVTLSARSGRYIVPKLFHGKPLDSNSPHPGAQIPAAMLLVPEAARLRVVRAVMAKAFERIEKDVGGPETWNLPKPSFPVWGDRPTISEFFIPALEEKRIEPRAGIAKLDGNTVHFTDGSSCEADVIIYATGYQLSFPFLKEEVLGGAAGDIELYQRIAHPQQRGLYFIGFTRVLCSLWPVSELQAKWLAQVLTGDIVLPDMAKQKKRAIQVAKTDPVFCNFHVLDLRADEV